MRRKIFLLMPAAFVFCFICLKANAQDKGVDNLAQIKSALSAANDSRSNLEKERAEWHAEASRLRLLVDALAEQEKRLKRDIEKTSSQSEKVEKELLRHERRHRHFLELNGAAKEVADRLQDALDAQMPSNFPGVIPVTASSAASPRTDPLSGAVERLGDAEQAGKVWSVEIVTGLLDGKELVIRLMRAGAVCAWWASLDGKKVGTAEMKNSKLELVHISDPKDASKIVEAFSLKNGRAIPARLPLPLSAGSNIVKAKGGEQ